MPINLNFFKKTNENLHPDDVKAREVPSFERVDTVGSKSSSLSVRSGKSQEEYKLSGEDWAQHSLGWTPSIANTTI